MKKHLFLILCLSLVAVACNKKTETQPLRPEYITVYGDDPAKTLSEVQVPFEGITDGQFHVLSNVPLQWKFLVTQDAQTPDWFVIKSIDEKETGHFVVTYDAASVLALNTLDRRSVHIGCSCPEQAIGKFIKVRQGYDVRFIEEFSEEPKGCVTLTGKQTYTTRVCQELNTDYCDYISFNAWAETSNEFLSKNITLDVTVSGGQFYDIGLTTYRVNVPIGTGPDASNMKYLLVVGNDGRMSDKTTFTFSVANDNLVNVHIDNFSAYQVAEAELFDVIDVDEEFYEQGEDWV